MLLNVQTGPQTSADGNTSAILRNGRNGELITGDQNGKFYEQASRGNVYSYGVASQAMLLTNTTGNVPTIFNPTGSGVNVSIQQLRLTWISGTTVVGGLIWCSTANAGAAPATGSPILTGTHVAPVKMNGFGASSSLVRWYPSVCTFTAAPVFFAATGIHQMTTALTGIWQDNVDGAIVVAPGSALSLCYTVTTSTALFAVSIIGIEIPI